MIKCIQCGIAVNQDNRFQNNWYRFRNGGFCSAKCNNNYMNRLEAMRETRRERFSFYHHWQKFAWNWFRGWLNFHWPVGKELCFNWEINLNSNLIQFGLGVHFNSHERDISWYLHLPFIRCYWGIEFPFSWTNKTWWEWLINRDYYYERYGMDPERSIQFYLIEMNGGYQFVMECFRNPNINRRLVKWWQYQLFYFGGIKELIFGRIEEIGKSIIDQGQVTIIMSEGNYLGNYKIEKTIYKRKRCRNSWSKILTTIDMTKCGGIPFAGKGTAEWNCGDDGLCVASFEESNLSVAAEQFRKKVLEYRHEYGEPSKRAICTSNE